MLRVSLCDDDTNFRALVRVVLSGEDDMEVVGESCDGRQCLEQIAESQPDAVLLDLEMPVMTGFEALARLVEVAPDTKVIVVSSESDAEATVRGLGAVGFIDKGGERFLASLAGQVRAALA